MDSFRSQIIHVVNTVDKLDLPDRLEALSYLQQITDAYKYKSVPSDNDLQPTANAEQPLNKNSTKSAKHKCKNHLCLINNIKNLKKIACCKCEKRLETEFQLYDHSRSHLDYPLSCIHCRCVFRNLDDFNCHKLVDCKQMSKDSASCFQKYTCTVCHSSFINKKTFQSHLLINHGMKLYNNWYGCKLCHEMFEQKKMLYHHYKHDHSDLKCPWEIRKKHDLESTSNNSKSDTFSKNDEKLEEPEKFECVHCGRKFVKKSVLSIHLKRHLENKHFACVLCKKSFTVLRNYKRHLQTSSHQSRDPQENYPLFKCDLCSKLFANHDALSRHNQRTHSGDRLLKCPLCDFKTSLTASLSRHVNLHTDNRKYICDQCGSCFHTLSALKEHTVYMHSSERNYSCEICGRRFKLKSGLNRHFKTHSNEKEFKCFCGQIYKFRTNLKRHLFNAHKIAGNKNAILRVTTEDEGYAMNSPKLVQSKKAKQKKHDLEESKIDEFDISSLTALSDIDLSCADEVLRETYDNFSKYSVENGESEESFNSILAPVNNLIDHVLQGTSNDARIKQPFDSKEFTTMNNETVTNFGNQLLSMNYRGATCRQYLNNSFVGDLSTDQFQLMEPKTENQCENSSFDGSVPTSICEGFTRQYNAAASLCFQGMPVEDESSFSYTKWLNEIL